MTPLCMVYFTAPNKDEAKYLIQSLLKARFIACATVIEGAASFFWWENEIKCAQEVIVWLKAPLSCRESIQRFLKENHSYEIPYVAFFQPSADDAVIEWLNASAHTLD